MNDKLNISPLRFAPVSAIAAALGRKKSTIQGWINEGELAPDAILIQKRRRPVALFTEDRIEQVRELVGKTASAACVAALALILAMAQPAKAQGVSTNDYSTLGPKGPFTLANTPSGVGGVLRHFQSFYPNLALGQGTNAAGVYTNNLAANSTNTYNPTNTEFVCSAYKYVSFQLTCGVGGSGANKYSLARVAFSQDGINFESSPTNVVLVPMTQLNSSVVATIPTLGAYAIALVALENTNSAASLTNLQNAPNTGQSGTNGGVAWTGKELHL